MQNRTLVALSVLLSSAPLAAGAARAEESIFDAPPRDGEELHLVVAEADVIDLAFVGLVQGQLAVLTGDDALIEDGDAAERMGVRLRRARFGVQGHAYKVIDFEVSVEAASEGAHLLDAYISYRTDTFLGLSLGARKIPFSRFALVGAGKGSLIERPFGVRALAPQRQVGLALEGEVLDRIVSYSVGVFNGFERNRNFYQGFVESNGFDGNRFSNLAIGGRIETEPLGRVGETLVDIDHLPFRFAVGGSVYWDDGETTEAIGWEADALFKFRGFHLAVEYLSDHAQPSTRPGTTQTIPAELTRSAFVGELGYVFLQRQLGLTLRGELIDDNHDLDTPGDSFVFTGGLQYYWHRHHLKAGLDYVHRAELEGAGLDNDTLYLQLQFEL